MRDYHVHTRWSDGRDTAEEMVLSAIRLGMAEIGFSDHTPMPYPADWTMKPEELPLYKEEIRALAEKYGDRISILCGVERDALSPDMDVNFDYVIGSTHVIPGPDGALLAVDHSAGMTEANVREHCGGDGYAYAEAYFASEARVVELTHCDIIGHFDLVAKYNETLHSFDESHPRYRAAWQAAADRLLETGVPFEINTGAIARGCRSIPYPAPEIREYLAAHGAKFILSSDSHATETIGYQFEKWKSCVTGSTEIIAK